MALTLTEAIDFIANALGVSQAPGVERRMLAKMYNAGRRQAVLDTRSVFTEHLLRSTYIATVSGTYSYSLGTISTLEDTSALTAANLNVDQIVAVGYSSAGTSDARKVKAAGEVDVDKIGQYLGATRTFNKASASDPKWCRIGNRLLVAPIATGSAATGLWVCFFPGVEDLLHTDEGDASTTVEWLPAQLEMLPLYYGVEKSAPLVGRADVAGLYAKYYADELARIVGTRTALPGVAIHPARIASTPEAQDM